MRGKVALATLAVMPMLTNNVYSENTGIVTAYSLNVRSGPSTSYKVVTTIKQNDKVNILQSSNGWYKIQTSLGKQGWVSSSYISISNNNETNTSSNIAIVNTDGLNFRTGAGISYSIIQTLNKGERVEVISESNGWSKVKYNSKTGYVSSKYIDNINNNYVIKVVNTEGLNVRIGPSTSYSSIGKLSKGSKVKVVSESNGWSKINYNDKVAYVYTKYLDKISDSESNIENYKEIKVVNIEGLNVRTGPSTSYSSIAKLSKGSKVKVISEANGWSKINYNDKVAYVYTKYLDKISDSESNIENYKEIKVVNIEGLNVRTGPSTSYSSIGKLSKGSKVKVISEANGWSKINYNDKVAYVYTKYLDKLSDNQQTAPIEGAAINYKELNYTLKNHIDVQYKKSLEGGNMIASNGSRSSEELTTYAMSQGRSFVPASKSDLEYYLNPNNFANSEKGMLQFLKTDTYKGGITESELNSYLNSLPKVNGKNTVFYNQGKTFISAAKKYDIDLVYLVSHAMWETGYGKSTLAQGQTITSYKGNPLPNPVTVYNFFGIGAIDRSANVSGAEASYSNGWTSIEKTIDGSAKWISENYIKNSKYNQNTIYKMKFNYDYSWHQYATDVNWPNGISGIMNKLIGMYDIKSNLVYEVPRYK